MYQKQQFWMFCVLLLVITLLSSFGGGIRYRENFLEEVFDLNDITNYITDNTNYHPVVFNPKVSEEEEAKKIEEETTETSVASVPVDFKQPEGVPQKIPNHYNIIEAYTGEAYAAF